MSNVQPLLNPPMRGWIRDLPGPYEKASDLPEFLKDAPNYVDQVCLEIPRAFAAVRGLLLWLSVPLIAATVWAVAGLCDIKVLHADTVLACFFSVSASVFGVAVGLRMDLSAPRDLPLRFNRVRRKVYIYDFKAIWWNPFTRWPVRAVSYNWDDIRAEAWHQHGMLNGMYVLKYGVALSVVKPGTNEVIDRFQLGSVGGEGIWAYICTYMQQGPQALPPSPYPPRDWNNEQTLNLARLLAPKVKWPPEMDVESRTAPAVQQVTSVV